MRRRLTCVFALWLAALPVAGGGCVTVGSHSDGNPIRWEAVAQLAIGTHTVADTLDLLGAPLEYQRHPDGTLLVYRHRMYHYLRVGLEPDLILTFTAAERVTSSLLENLRLVIESGDEFEERVAVYYGRDGVLAGVGTHRRRRE